MSVLKEDWFMAVLESHALAAADAALFTQVIMHVEVL